MKKKVLLVGWRNSVNFGTNLQAIALYTVIRKNFGKDYAAELAVTIVFVVVVRYLNLWQGCLAYLAAIAGYTVIYRKEILNLLKSLKNAIKNKFSKEKEES